MSDAISAAQSNDAGLFFVDFSVFVKVHFLEKVLLRTNEVLQLNTATSRTIFGPESSEISTVGHNLCTLCYTFLPRPLSVLVGVIKFMELYDLSFGKIFKVNLGSGHNLGLGQLLVLVEVGFVPPSEKALKGYATFPRVTHVRVSGEVSEASL